MPYSMTGFASADAVSAPFQIAWEIRSVNHRYLDITLRMPEEFRQLESSLRDALGRLLRRGKVDCSLKLTAQTASGAETEVDHDLLAELRRLQASVHAELPDARPLSVYELLRWPGVLTEPAQDVESLAAPVAECLERAALGLQEARAREGARIGDALKQRVAAIDELLGRIKPHLDDLQLRHRDRLRERVAKLGVQADPERLEQELALIAQRLDVAEEIDRLEAHLLEVGDLLTSDEPIGRQLDFLMQELNREANTFASKVQDEELTHRAVDLKVLIEQMREQVQNLE